MWAVQQEQLPARLHGDRMVIACAVPTLELQRLALDGGDLFEETVMMLGSVLRAWPTPALEVSIKKTPWKAPNGAAQLVLQRIHQELERPADAAEWNDATTLHYFAVQQNKVGAFAFGLLPRLGAASPVACLNHQLVLLIADEVLGRRVYDAWVKAWESGVSPSPQNAQHDDDILFEFDV